MIKGLFVLALAGAATATASPPPTPTPTLPPMPPTPPPSTVAPGDFRDIPVTKEAADLLAKALADDTKYDSRVSQRVCVYTITSLAQQVVAGYNYKYRISGCAFKSGKEGGGECPTECEGGSDKCSAGCKLEPFTVLVFTQSWTNTVSILQIDGGNGTKPSPAPTPAPSPAPTPAPTTPKPVCPDA